MDTRKQLSKKSKGAAVLEWVPVLCTTLHISSAGSGQLWAGGHRRPFLVPVNAATAK